VAPAPQHRREALDAVSTNYFLPQQKLIFKQRHL